MKRLAAALILLMMAQPALAVTPITPIHAHIATARASIPLTLQLANTSGAREHGLMKRKTLQPFDGMAFFFPTIAPQKFWMKDTLIPLDILFVDEAGTIVYIATAKPLSLEPVGPDSPVATVIELAGGRAVKSGIAVGDKVTYEIDTTPGAMAY